MDRIGQSSSRSTYGLHHYGGESIYLEDGLLTHFTFPTARAKALHPSVLELGLACSASLTQLEKTGRSLLGSNRSLVAPLRIEWLGSAPAELALFSQSCGPQLRRRPDVGGPTSAPNSHFGLADLPSQSDFPAVNAALGRFTPCEAGPGPLTSVPPSPGLPVQT